MVSMSTAPALFETWFARTLEPLHGRASVVIEETVGDGFEVIEPGGLSPVGVDGALEDANRPRR